jgi:L-alanine-DL-glutamate epimerase-like enolase superfamily enzyme
MVDGNKRLTVEQGFEVVRGLDRLGFTWFEEPFSLKDIEGYARLSAAVGMPISGGEQFTTLEQFRPCLEQHALSIVQLDVACCGITEALRIARMAERYSIDLCPHNWHHGLMTMANAQLVAAIPNTRVLELRMIQGPLQWGILARSPPSGTASWNCPTGLAWGLSWPTTWKRASHTSTATTAFR